MLTAEMSHKHIYHLRCNCLLGKDRFHFLTVDSGDLKTLVQHRNVCVHVRKRAKSVVPAGVNTAQMIKVDAFGNIAFLVVASCWERVVAL